MTSMHAMLWLALGLIALLAGAELLVRGASRLAQGLGVPPLLIGLTVVGFGTSAPEAAVSLVASAREQGGIALGNVVGSNICNVLLILGAGAVVRPLVISRTVIVWHMPFLVLVSGLVWLLCLDGGLGRGDGGLLAGAGLVYAVLVVLLARRDPRPARPQVRRPGSLAFQIGCILAGLALLVVGSRWMVNGAVSLATLLGMSQLAIGATIVALGTSLPELATSLLAGLRGEGDLCVGNVVGSNFFNLLAILGPSALVAHAGLPVPPAALHLDLPALLAAALLCLPICRSGHRISRAEGALLLCGYVAFVAAQLVQRGA